MATVEQIPHYRELILPVVRAVDDLGSSAQGREITARVIEALGFSDETQELTYPTREKSILVDRLEWARSYAKMMGALDRPRRGLYLLAPLGKELLAESEETALQRIEELDREVRRERRQARKSTPDDDPNDSSPLDDEDEDSSSSPWRDHLLQRLHSLTPEGFEEFVMYLLRTYGLEMTRTGGSGDEGIDGIGLAPINDVLSTRVAVQAKRYDPANTISRDQVALFQRDAAAAGAERAIFVTLSRFSEPSRKAATMSMPTVDLIDGEKLCDLALKQEIGIRIVPEVESSWFDRFD